jgi:hypothetical protein
MTEPTEPAGRIPAQWTTVHTVITEDVVPGMRLGRNVRHDSRSLQYRYQAAEGITLANTSWPRHIPILDQGDVGCHSDRTEVLTETGWQPWPSYDGTALGTVNPATRVLEFQAPSALHAYDYRGEMYRISHKSLDWSLTPNHRMWVRPWSERDRRLAGAFAMREVAGLGWYAGLMAAPSGYHGLDLGSLHLGQMMTGDDFAALMALVASDGWVGGTDANRARVSFCCFRDDRYPMVSAVAARLGFREQRSRRGVWYRDDEELARWFRGNLYDGTVLRSPFKRLPQAARVLGTRQAALFLDAYGDQHARPDGARQFYTASAAMAGGLQEMMIRAGTRGGYCTRPARVSQMADGRLVRGGFPEYVISERRDALSVERKRQVGTEPYDGVVYCATVPNGTLITRLDGHVLISGNSCTGNALTGALGCDPLNATLPAGHPALDEAEALRIYSEAEDIDGDGPYPPNDNGSSGLSVAQAAKADGLISGYTHCLSLADVQAALMAGPVLLGLNWYSSFDRPASSGLVAISKGAYVRGGHEVLARSLDVDHQLIGIDNSWGTSWGAGGSFTMGWATLDRLLHEQGDGTVLVPLSQPAPTPAPTPVPPGPAADPDATFATAARAWLTAKGL